MAKNVQGVIFLRNGNLYASRDVALNALSGDTLLNRLNDGEMALARYGSGSNVKTLAGIMYKNGDNKSITVIDVEGASADVEALREQMEATFGTGVTTANTATAQLAALSGNTASTSADTSVEGAKRYAEDLIGTLDGGVTAETGSYVVSVSEVDGKISGTTEALPTVAAISEAGKPITAVSESLGEISATAGTIDAQYVTATGFTATDVQGALEEVKANIGEAISGLDYSDTAVAGEYVSEVNEVDGVISVTRAELPSVTGQAESKKVVISVSEDKGTVSDTKGTISSSAQTIVLTDNADGGVNFEVHIDNDTLQKDENGVISVTSSALVQYEGDDDTIQISAVSEGVRTVSSPLTIQKVTTGLSEEVKEEYHLVGHSGNTIGEPIKIYKDSHIVSINYIDDPADPNYQKLEYVYVNASGVTSTTYVDMSELVLEAEFASGVTVTNHVSHGVVDPTSESYLTVGADGFKLSGVDAAITAAVEDLDADESGSTTHITVNVVEQDGIITGVNLEEDNIADADDLAQEILDRESGDTALSNRLGEGVTAENTAAAQLAALSGDSATAQSGDTSVEGAKKYADAKLAEVVADLDATVSGESTHVNVEVSEENGVITAVTVVEDNIADADDLAELSGKTITAITSTNGSIAASISNEAGNKTADIQTDADKIQMSGFTAGADTALSGIAESDSIATAFEKTNAVITENERVTAEALTDLDTRVDTISGDVDTIKEQYISGVSVNGTAVTVTNNVAPISISGSTAAPSGTVNDPAIIVNTDANGAVTLGIGYIDCGTYDDPQP